MIPARAIMITNTTLITTATLALISLLSRAMTSSAPAPRAALIRPLAPILATLSIITINLTIID